MLDIRSIYIANGVGIGILLMLYYTSRTQILRRRIEDKVYSWLMLGVMLGCFMEAFSYTIDGKVFAGSRILNYIANTYLFSVNLLLPFFILVFIDLRLYGDPSRIWEKYRPQIFIGVFMFIMNIANFFVPISYVITEQNVYERRPFSYIYYFVILYYCLSAVKTSRQYEKENGAKAFFSVKMFLIPIIVGAGLQVMFYGLSVAWLAAAIGRGGLYMMQQNEIAYIDPLTDTYNRQYMNNLLSSWIRRGMSFCGAMIDVDRFKHINDTYGHSEGDRALQTVADLLKVSRMDGEIVIRFAGDEFIVLKRSDEANGLAAYMRNVEGKLKRYNRDDPRYPLSLSYGVSFFETGDVDKFLKEIDERMYLMKEEHHKAEKK